MEEKASLKRAFPIAAVLLAALLVLFALDPIPAGASLNYTWSGSEDALAETVDDDGNTTIEIGGSGTLTLTGDTEANIVVTGSSDVVIDLAGYTLTGAGGNDSTYITASYDDGVYAVESSEGSVIGVFGGEANLEVADGSEEGTGTVTGGDANRGGGIYFAGDTLTLAGGTITGNTAHTVTVSAANISSWSGTFTSYGLGGGIYVDYGAVFVMEGGSVSSNTADSSGGGVYVAGSMDYAEGGTSYSTADATFVMEGGDISGNTAASKGGGVYAGGVVEVTGGAISGNTLTNSTSYGAGVYVSSSGDASNLAGYSDQYYIYYLSDMTSSELSSNAKGSDGSLLMSGGAVSGNSGAYYGGGIYACGASFELRAGTVSNNSASCGGGICLETDGAISGGSITGNDVSDNGGDGGGLYVYEGAVATISDGDISSNTAAYGGGVYIYDADGDGTVVTMSGGSITGNSATGAGGGIYNDSSTLACDSAGPVIANNSADTRAADVYANAAATTTLPRASSMGQTYAQTGIDIDGWYADASGARYADGSIENVATPDGYTGAALSLIAACSDEDSTMTITATVTFEDGMDIPDSVTLVLVRVSNDSSEGSTLLQTVTVTASDEWSYTFTVARSSDTTDYYVYSIMTADGESITQACTVDFSSSLDYEAEVEIVMTDEAAEASLSCGSVTWTFANVEEAAVYAGSIIAYAESVDGASYTQATLTLLADAVVQETLALSAGDGESLVLDLAGHTLAMADAADDGNVYDESVSEAGGSVLRLSGTVTVTSSAVDDEGEAVAGTITGGVAAYGGGIYIEDDADVTLENVVITGNSAENGGGVYMAGGSLVIEDGTCISGNEATGSGYDEETDSYTFYISELDDEEYTAGFACGGGIYVGGAGTLVMNGGEVSGNSATRGGGVYVGQDASFTLNDGSISENTAWSATVYLVNSSGTTYTLVYDYTLLLGASSYEGGDYNILGCAYGGGVYLDYGSSMTMNGGSVDSNESEWSGGGIYVSGSQSYTGSVSGYVISYEAASFTMYGGSITDNTCVRKGGGIMLAGEGVIYAGTIENNSATGEDMTIGGSEYLNASGLGGGIYVSGEDDSDNAGNVDFWIIFWASTMKSSDLTADAGAFGGEGSLTIYSTVITENTASVLGGGIWSCHAGTLAMNMVSGAAVFDNDALSDDGTKDSTQAGDDIASVAKDSDSDDAIELSSSILGGGSVVWYYDGAIDDETHPDVGTATSVYTDPTGTVHDVPRYDNEADDEHDAIDEDDLTISTSFAAKAVVSDSDKAAALAAATVVISGNSASRGGGIGNNGSVTAGTAYDDDMSITVSISKTWENDDSATRPDAVYVTVYYTVDGVTYSATVLTLTADDDSIDGDPDTWTASFTVDGLPAGSVVSVKEVDVDGYTAAYAGTVQNEDGTYSLVLNGDDFGSYALEPSESDDEENVYELQISNISLSGTVRIAKYGEDGETLSGATFALYQATVDDDGAYSVAEEASAAGTSDANGIVKFYSDDDDSEFAMAVGTTWKLVETNAAQGYASVSPIRLYVDTDGAVYATWWDEDDEERSGSFGSTLTYDSESGAYELSIYDEELEGWDIVLVKYGTTNSSGNELAGAVFALYVADSSSDTGMTLLSTATSSDGESEDEGDDGLTKGTVVWYDSDGARIALSAGTTYYIVETSAPDGYSLAGTLAVAVGGDGSLSVSVGGAELGSTATEGDYDYYTVDDDSRTVTITLTDDCLYSLPESAGAGMLPVWLLGILLATLAGAGYMALSRQRESRAEAFSGGGSASKNTRS